MAPRVSVIIPCYNGERYLAQAMESVLAQTERSLELIISDDGSTDASEEIVNTFANDDRIVHSKNTTNTGIAACRNRGINLSTGEFIAFLDQDDIWKPDKIERQLTLFDSHNGRNTGLVFSYIDEIQEKTQTSSQPRSNVPPEFNTMSRIDILMALYMENFMPFVTIIVRRTCLDTVGFLNEDIKSGIDDYEFCLRVAEKFDIKHIPLPLATRRVHDTNYTNAELMIPDAIELLEQLSIQHPELRALRNKRMSDLLYRLARDLHAKGQKDNAKQIYANAAMEDRSYLKPALALMLCRMGRLGDFVLDSWNAAAMRMRK